MNRTMTDAAQRNFNHRPQHPAAHGVLRLVLELTARWEGVSTAWLLHRGTEADRAQDLSAGDPGFDRPIMSRR
jgi:NADH:ubiquinone oxidoreductase subunit D